jgi:subtilisin family serine protease
VSGLIASGSGSPVAFTHHPCIRLQCSNPPEFSRMTWNAREPAAGRARAGRTTLRVSRMRGPVSHMTQIMDAVAQQSHATPWSRWEISAPSPAGGDSFVDRLDRAASLSPDRRFSALVILRGPVSSAVYGADSDGDIQRDAIGIVAEAGMPELSSARPGTVIRHVLDNLVDPNSLRNIATAPIVRRGGMVIDAPADELLRIANSPSVESIQEEVQYGLSMDNARPLAGIDAAYEAGLAGDQVVVAIIDTGIDVDHPAFAGRISSLSRNFIIGEVATDYRDFDGHGTYVAGIIGGDGSPSSMCRGVAPGATLLILRAFSTAGGRSGDVVSAINYAASKGAQVINLSAGYPDLAAAPGVPWVWSNSRSVEENALGGALANGIPCIVAAGNYGPTQSTVTHPGVMQEALTVGCTDLNTAAQAVSPLSSQGPARRTSMIPAGVYLPSASLALGGAPILHNDKPDVVAPGGSRVEEAADGACRTPHGIGVTSTTAAGAGGTWRACAYPSEPYTSAAGTSGATALVSGLCALALQQISDLDIDLSHYADRAMIIQNMIKATATDLGLARYVQGYGAVNWLRLGNLIGDIAAGRDYPDNYRIDPLYPR